ncbi:hypothetical protein H5410_032219 [Solanum commersonii]|uniref:Uncharacterized protein n=1 Tax=Solanum commersonii TaxID=4109 RepID=A0A9J5YKH2_SOLCO|nr:hypothetical protein H5410_032219 [Solanum commersonii]
MAPDCSTPVIGGFFLQCNSRNLSPMLCMKWVQHHGDRVGYDDTAMMSDIGSIEGRSYLLIGHQLCNDNPL